MTDHDELHLIIARNTQMTETTDDPVKPGRRDTALAEVRKTAHRVGQAAEGNPLAIVAGGIALGVVAGALLPKSRRETELLGPVGKRMTDVASGAADAARGAATAELASLPLSKSAAREQVGRVLEQIAKALSSAGEAALNSSQQTTVVAEKVKPAKKTK
jgi:hypothetical protein